jgi:hypothetical protein
MLTLLSLSLSPFVRRLPVAARILTAVDSLYEFLGYLDYEEREPVDRLLDRLHDVGRNRQVEAAEIICDWSRGREGVAGFRITE